MFFRTWGFSHHTSCSRIESCQHYVRAWGNGLQRATVLPFPNNSVFFFLRFLFPLFSDFFLRVAAGSRIIHMVPLHPPSRPFNHNFVSHYIVCEYKYLVSMASNRAPHQKTNSALLFNRHVFSFSYLF